MKVILLERVDRLGGIGETVQVKDGFARNFLLPRQKALRATEANQKIFDAQRATIEARNAANKAEAEKSGSVAARDVADAIKAEGGAVERSQVVLNLPIKTLGVHEVKIRLHSEVTITVKVNVARSQDEAERQAKGENVITSQFEEERAIAEEAAEDMKEGGAGEAIANAGPGEI